MSKHTPGPWTATADYYGEVVVDSSGKEIVVLLGSNAVPNARLIAAAPNLLKALKLAEKQLIANVDTLNAIRAAIAKAEEA